MTNGTGHEETMPQSYQLELTAQRKELQRLGELLAATQTAPEDDDAIDLREYWQILLRRRRTVFTVLGVAVVIALLYTFLATPIYRGTLLLQIDRQDSKVLNYQTLTSDQQSGDAKDFYETQYELLKSRSLARRVIDQLGLESSPELAGNAGKGSFFGSVTKTVSGWLSGREADPAGAGSDKEKTPDLEKAFLDNLTIEPVRNSELVRVSYDSPNPKEAALITNAVAKNFINISLERRFDASSNAKTFLEGQIKQARANLDDSERRLVAYARERGIVDLEDRMAILLQKLKDMNSELIKAQADRIQAEANYNELVKEGSYNTGAVLDSTLIQKLKEHKAKLEATYQDQLKIYKPGYPKMQQLRRQIAETQREIAQESASIANSVKTIFQSKVRQEVELKQRIAEIKQEILQMQDRSTDYQALKRDVDTNRQLYDGLLQRMKEVGVVGGIGNNNIAIIDPAEVPKRKYKPSLTKDLAVAVAIGLFGGILLAFLFETLDDTLKTSAEVERRIGAPVLGVAPFVSARAEAIEADEIAVLAYKNPRSALAESYRSLRTALTFSTAEGAPKVIHFTSAGAVEGKTTSSISTAITFAQTGNKVLLIDGDLRNPSLHKAFSLPNAAGLTNYLAGDAKPARIAHPTRIKGLFAITSGPLPPNPVELLSTAKMMDLITLAAERFDYVIIDGPPVVGLADAVVLARLARATIVTVEAGSTRIGALEGSVKRLRDANAPVLGAVLAKFGKAGSGYGYGYDYHYTYGYGSGAAPTTALAKPESP